MMLVSVAYVDDNGRLVSAIVDVENSQNTCQAESMAADTLRQEGFTVCRARACQGSP